jgi:hypothetical protein
MRISKLILLLAALVGGLQSQTITLTKYPAPAPSSCLSSSTPACYWPLNQGFGKISPANVGAWIYADRQKSTGTVTVSGGTSVAWTSGDQFGARTWGLAAGDTITINGTSFTIVQGSVTATALTITSASSNGTFAYSAGGGGSGTLVVSTDVYNWSTTAHKFSYYGGNGTLTQADAALETDDPTLPWPADRQQEEHQFYDSTRSAVWLTGGLAAGRYFNCMTSGGASCTAAVNQVFWRHNLLSNTWTALQPSHHPIDNLSAGQASAIDTKDQIILQAGYSATLGWSMGIYCPTDLNPTPGTLTVNQTHAGCIQTAGVDDWCIFNRPAQGCATVSTGITLPAINQPQVLYSQLTEKFYLFGGMTTVASSPYTVNTHIYVYSPLARDWEQVDTGPGCPMQSANSLSVNWTPGVAALTSGQFMYHYFPQALGGTASDWIFDPIMGSCTQITTVGSGPIGISGSQGGTTLAQDPSTGTIVAWYQGGSDNGVWEGVLSDMGPVSSGLGHSTYNCIDVDGDGYGVGPGCTGADADDNDASVHSDTNVLSKWGTLAAYYTHMGWNPVHVLYVDGGAGSCTPITTPFAYSALTACSTVDAAIAAMAAGDAVVVRGGTYTRATGASIVLLSGTLAGTPGTGLGPTCSVTNYYLSYPGELPDFEWSGFSNGVNFTSGSQSCYIVDGWKVHGFCSAGNNGSCVGRGFPNSGPSTGVPVYGAILSHVDVSGFTDNVFPQFDQVGTKLLHNYMHDAFAGTDGHVIYIGSDCPGGGLGLNPCGPVSSNSVVVAGNIITDAIDTCLHANGPISGMIVDSNMIYGCDKAINFQSGINHSLIQNNTVHTSGVNFQLNTYSSGYGAPNNELWQCHDQNYNTVRNNTFFMDAQQFNPALMGTIDAGTAAIYLTDGGGTDTGGCLASRGVMPDLGHNTYDNNVLVHSCGTNCFDYKGPILRYYSPSSTGAALGWLQTDIYRNNVFKNFDVNTRIVDPVGSSTVFQNCSWFTNTANVPLASGNVCDSDPLFVAANPAWSALPANWNLSVQSGSPALGAGLVSDAAAADMTGIVRGSLPSMGAFQNSGGVVVPPSFCSGCKFTGTRK